MVDNCSIMIWYADYRSCVWWWRLESPCLALYPFLIFLQQQRLRVKNNFVWYKSHWTWTTPSISSSHRWKFNALFSFNYRRVIEEHHVNELHSGQKQQVISLYSHVNYMEGSIVPWFVYLWKDIWFVIWFIDLVYSMWTHRLCFVDFAL